MPSSFPRDQMQPFAAQQTTRSAESNRRRNAWGAARGWISGLLVAIGALALYARTAAPTITARFGGADGGELTAVALNGGVAHPSGYPTYLLLARLALYLPAGEPAARLALFSALCGALVVGATMALLIVVQPRPRRSLGAALLAGAALALSPRLWSQAIIVEVYTLALLWLVIVVLLGMRWLRSGRSIDFLAAMFCLGVGLGSHLTIAALLPALAAGWIVAPRRPPLTRRTLGGALPALLIGLSVYGLLPVWAARNSLPSWGDPSTFSGWLAHITGAEYRYLVGVVPWSQRLSRVGFAARDLLVQPGIIGLLVVIGWVIPHGWRVHRSLISITITLALSSVLFAISYGGADGMVYLLPWTWCWYVWLGLGLEALMQPVFVQPTRKLLRLGVPTLVIGALLWQAYRQYPQFNLRADTSERDWIVGQLRAVPPNTIVMSNDDRVTFSVWYAQTAFNTRRDVIVIDVRLLQQPWYDRQVRAALGGTPAETSCTRLARTDRPIYGVIDQQFVPTAPPPCAAQPS